MKRARTAVRASAQVPAQPFSPPSAPDWRGCALVFAAALAVRAANAWFILTPENPHLDPAFLKGADMWGNQMQALEVLERGFPREFFHHAPLYVYLAAGAYALFEKGYYVLYALQILAGAALCALIYETGRRKFNPPTGILAAAIAVLYAPLIFNELTFMADSLAPAMALGTLALAERFQTTQRPMRLAAVLGLALGALVAERANFALFGPAIGLWMMLAGRKHPAPVRLACVGIVAAVSLAFIAPFCVHNSLVEGKLSFTQGEAYKPWRIGWGEETTGYFFYPQGFPQNPLHVFHRFGWVPLLLRKIAFLASWFEFPDLYNFYVDGRFSPLLRWNPVRFVLVGPLALLGMILEARRARELSPLYLGVGVIAVSILLYYVAGRFRAAMMPILILFAASACVQIARAALARRWARLAAALSLLAAAAWGCNALDPSRFHSIWYSDSMMESGFMNFGMRAMNEEKDLARARRSFERLLWIKRANAALAGHSALAVLEERAGRGEASRAHAETAARLSELLGRQAPLDQFGNSFFPPTSSFGPHDPYAAAVPPPDWLPGIKF